VLGYCGRIVVTEHAGQPLSSFLKEDFKKRADIGMMLLGMIFFLQVRSTNYGHGRSKYIKCYEMSLHCSVIDFGV